MSTLRRRTALLSAVALLVLTAAAWLHPVIAGDSPVGRRLLAVPGSAGWHVASAISFVASGPVVALAGALAAVWTAWRLRRPADALAIVLAPAIAGAIEVGLKSLVGRARPLTAALSGESGNGYPSGHVTGFTALAVTLLVVWVLQPAERTPAERRTASVGVGAAVALVAWSRVALGAHYVSDVVGGALLGLTVGLLCPWLCALGWSHWRSRSRALV